MVYKGQEWFEVYDDEGNLLTTAPRKICHNRTFLRHKSVHLMIRDNDGRFLLQKRSAAKDIQPGKWDTSVGGHVDPGESVEQAVLREAREELGLVLRPEEIRFEYDYSWVSSREKEWVHTFSHRTGRKEFVFDRGELDEVRFWTENEISRSLGQDVFTPNFEDEFRRFREKSPASKRS
jgi:isopentenyldiphosphate isomerase